ncbi:methylated-DNA-[protein]-cysteine S-methyltransferase [Nocardiopsis mwathae]|uniref:Methylated-DNA--protein-cysteine methyltransferase n=1 Tax=Nocardiopsis mwathae TaxID=1472723 RepID=A0A7W9YDA5_9ACTN|nr:methylated-DNA--[protein]-cysteine S-methyltransferase [Nocardiopsis mwathae]MBB6170002.1 methylated-DNA-[protein]-cysteine S-methyltransferase [Nocardiopsis mwathae]
MSTPTAQDPLPLDVPDDVADPPAPAAVPAAEFARPGDGPTLYTTMASPVGEMLLTGDGEALTGVFMLPEPECGPGRVEADWKHVPDGFRETRRQLAAYFAGELTAFDLPLAPRGTEFQLRVWRELTTIPYGRTTSYGAIAAALGRPTASRAVGMANGRNPISIIVPCHRVVGADGSLTGYASGLPRKRHLLRLEGLTHR